MWTVVMPWTRPPLQANDRRGWRANAAIVASTRQTAGWVVKAAAIRCCERIRVQLFWRPNVRRRRDGGENLAPTMKPIIDGIVDAGVVVDDEYGRVERAPTIILPVSNAAPGAVWITITDLGEDRQ